MPCVAPPRLPSLSNATGYLRVIWWKGLGRLHGSKPRRLRCHRQGSAEVVGDTIWGRRRTSTCERSVFGVWATSAMCCQVLALNLPGPGIASMFGPSRCGPPRYFWTIGQAEERASRQVWRGPFRVHSKPSFRRRPLCAVRRDLRRIRHVTTGDRATQSSGSWNTLCGQSQS